jgi:hypothetical protein
MPRERMLVLASSQKLGGRCVAGLGLDSERLLRPVSRTQSGTLNLPDCRVDGTWPRLLKVVEFGYRGPDGRPWQPENLVLDDTRWRSCAAIPVDRLGGVLAAHLHRGGTLLGNRGAAVPVEECEHGLGASLALVEPDDLTFEHEQVDWGRGGRPRAWFRHGGRLWRLPLTDFVVRPQLLKWPFGVYDWDQLELHRPRRVLLTLSLGEPHRGWHHKLVAAVVPLG